MPELAHSRSAPTLGHARSAPLLAAAQASLGGHIVPSKGQLIQLTKPEVKELRRRELGLQPYQDEKRGICEWRIDQMHECYDAARRKREELKILYEKRHQDVLRAIGEIRAEIVEHIKKFMAQISEYDQRFLMQLEKNRAEWKFKCAGEHDLLVKRNKAFSLVQDDLREQLEVEARECTQTLLQKRAELDVTIAKQAKWLQEQIKERKQGEVEWSAAFRERFAELKERLAEEAEARRVRCDEEKNKAKKLFRELSEKQQKADLKAKVGFEEIQAALEFEQDERAQSQEIVVENMQGFFEQIEANVGISVANQRASQKRLLESSGLAAYQARQEG